MICKFRADFGKYNDARYSSYEFSTKGEDLKSCYISAVNRASDIATIEGYQVLSLTLINIVYTEEDYAVV